MRTGWHHHLAALGMVGVFAFLHYWWRWQLAPIVPWPLVLSVFAACTYRNSFILLLTFILVGELFSWLPPGVMTMIVTLPYFTSRLLVVGARLWSPRLWLVVALTIGLQLLVNIGGYLGGEGLFQDIGRYELWRVVPWTHIASQWAASTFLTSLAVGVWYEVRPST